MNEWIKVSDKLPERNDWVLVSHAKDYAPITIARHTGDKWEFFYRDGYDTSGFSVDGPYCGDAVTPITIGQITCWMKIPTSPKEDPGIDLGLLV
jgi:hypothetical protein